MKKWIAVLVALVLLLGALVAAGPWLTVNAIRDAVRTGNTAKLSRHVDFPALRSSLRIQLDDYVVRRAGPEAQASLFGAIAVRIASGIASGTVDVMVTPAGLGGLLGGRTLWHRVSGGGIGTDPYAHVPPPDPLSDAAYGFESPSRFTATVIDDSGQPVVFVLTRHGLRWKLSDVRLPLGAAQQAQPAR